MNLNRRTEYGEKCPKKNRGLFRLADVDTCGGAHPYFLCISKSDSKIRCVCPENDDPSTLFTCLLHDRILDLAECLLLIRNWYNKTNRDLTTGENAMRLFRILDEPCFKKHHAVDFWCPTFEYMATCDYGDEDGFPENFEVSLTPYG